MPKSRPKPRAPKIGPVGQRPGVLTPDEFEKSLFDALGGRGWQKTFARGSGLAPSTITRYLQGVYPIPQYIGLIVEMLQTLRRNRLPIPDVFSVAYEGAD